MMNTFERDTIAEIKARVLARKPVADWEKQMVLDLLKREGLAVRADVIRAAKNSGFNVEGVKAL